MNKYLVRIGAGLLAALMLTPIFASCNKATGGDDEHADGEQTTVASGDNGEQGENQGSVDKVKTEAVLPNVNYEGYDFQILARQAEQVQIDLWVGSDKKMDSVDEQVWARQQFISENFGVDLVMNITEKDGGGGVNTSQITSISAGSCEYDLIATHGRSAMDYALNGCGYNWYDLKWVDLDSTPWWCQGAVSNWTINNKVYCMVGDLSYMNVGQANCMYFNKSLLDDAHIDYPYEDVANGTWTLEKMKTMALDAYAAMDSKTGSGKLADDSFAYTSGWWRGAMQLRYSAGQFVITGNTKEDLKITEYNEVLQDAYTSYIDNFLATSACSDEAPENYNLMQEAFMDDRVVFYDDLVEESQTFDKIDFGIVPWPKANERVEGYPSLVNAYSNVFVVPLCVKDAERTSVVLEAMAFFGYRNIVPQFYDEVIMYQKSPDPESTQSLKLIRESLVYDLGYYYTLGGIGDIGRMCYEAGSAAGMSAYFRTYATVASEKLTDLYKLG